MYKGKKILAIIPARGGSKGVVRKNLRPLGGKPLLAWTAAAARGSEYLDRTILSSEDDEIIALAGELGLDVPFKRPEALARDDTPGIAPVLHALELLKTENYDYVVLLQPTSPLRQAADIDAAISRCIDGAAPACVSVCETPHPPWWMFGLDAKNRLVPVLDAAAIPARRQDAPRTYQLNGAVYVAQTAWLTRQDAAGQPGFIGPETLASIMPYERSLDIDTETDLELAEILLRQSIKS